MDKAQTFAAYVYMRVSGYDRVEGNRWASRNGLSHPKSLTFRFANFASLTTRHSAPPCNEQSPSQYTLHYPPSSTTKQLTVQLPLCVKLDFLHSDDAGMREGLKRQLTHLRALPLPRVA
jgi:hypothetical protein